MLRLNAAARRGMMTFVSLLLPVANGPVEHPKMSFALGFGNEPPLLAKTSALLLTCPLTLP